MVFESPMGEIGNFRTFLSTLWWFLDRIDCRTKNLAAILSALWWHIPEHKKTGFIWIYSNSISMHALIAVQSLSARSSIARRGNLKSSGEKKRESKIGKRPRSRFRNHWNEPKEIWIYAKKRGLCFFPGDRLIFRENRNSKAQLFQTRFGNQPRRGSDIWVFR